MKLGVTAERAYGDWREMLAGERDRPDCIDLVTIASPNATHYEIAKGFLAEEIAVLCEKPMTMTVAEAEDLTATVKTEQRCLRRQLPVTPAMRWCAKCGRWSPAAISAGFASSRRSSRMASTLTRRTPTIRAYAGATIRHRPALGAIRRLRLRVAHGELCQRPAAARAFRRLCLVASRAARSRTTRW